MIYVIGDLHLSFGVENKEMDKFGYKWENHTERLKKDWLEKVKPADTVILAGDFSWANSLEEVKKDFEYISSLPGKKILIKGNHDYWWNTVTKMEAFLKENNFSDIFFLYNNSYEVEDYEIVGTKGWSEFEVSGYEKNVLREINRLKLSISSTKTEKDKIAILHYPPFMGDVDDMYKFTKVLEESNIKKCYYAHLHGFSHNRAIQGMYNGVEYILVSGDYVDFKLQKIK